MKTQNSLIENPHESPNNTNAEALADTLKECYTGPLAHGYTQPGTFARQRFDTINDMVLKAIAQWENVKKGMRQATQWNAEAVEAIRDELLRVKTERDNYKAKVEARKYPDVLNDSVFAAKIDKVLAHYDASNLNKVERIEAPVLRSLDVAEYWQSHEGICLGCKAEIAREDQYCPSCESFLIETLTTKDQTH